MADKPSERRERTNNKPLDAAAWIMAPLALAFLSVATPVLAENPFFFAAHGVSALIFAALLLAGVVVATALVWLLLFLVRRFGSDRSFDAVTSALTFLSAGLAVTAIVVKILSGLAPAIAWILGGLVGVLGGLLIAVIARRVSAGRVVLVAAMVATLFPLVTFSSGGDARQQVSIAFDDAADRPPILLMVADELSYSVISEADGTVRPVFPNLAALQSTATTYTNAYATANATHFAVPTLLAGIPDATKIGEYPQEVTASGGPLSWLQSRYQVATDSIYFQSNDDGVPFVDLGTGSLVREESGSAAREALILTLDSAAVIGRTSLPSPLAEAVPTLDDRWYDFWDLLPEPTVVGVGGDFVEVLTGDDPGFVFWHSMVSHTPYVRDYNGQFWSPNSLGLTEAGLGTNAVAELQRQVYASAAMDVDRHLGWMMDQLKANGTFDETLIIVTADHGRTFPLETPWRVGDTREQRWRDVAHVPLFVKESGQSLPERVVAPRSTAQISQTLLDAAGAEVAMDTPRAPGLSSDLAEPPVFWFDLRTGQPGVETYEPQPIVDEWSGSYFAPRHPDSPFAVGIDPALIGGPVPAGITQAAVVPAQFDDASSNLRVLEVPRSSEACAAEDEFGLVSYDGAVVGSIAWGADREGSVTGWAIVPEFDGGEYQIWCSAG